MTNSKANFSMYWYFMSDWAICLLIDIRDGTLMITDVKVGDPF